MTKRKHSDFPLFTEFVRGYLHQDAVPEHGNAIGAAKAYLEDLPDEDRKALTREIQRLREKLSNVNTAELNARLRELGAAWRFDSQDEFEQVLRLLERSR